MLCGDRGARLLARVGVRNIAGRGVDGFASSETWPEQQCWGGEGKGREKRGGGRERGGCFGFRRGGFKQGP